MPTLTQDRLPGLALPHQDIRPTITEQFHDFDAQHPWVYRALEQLVAQRLAVGATRVGMKALFEALRWRHPHGVKGLNNNYTALYARRLLAAHPE
ncbi:hypothetical protein SSP35_22_00190 [Streptomyces sp. NBRC 110611]|uniref:hypothetical protein n=1 Tax=Streptomyces sp. NBRC 110611 TaxID=1621259 RepID=UPI000858BAD8|nr:hypothetical protein [Streptomyces sp. NBRC 110611]GAU70716.1 hypothetical protein SSP35_22_00190 [Streptomyces sp. NBRC 110611]